MRGFFVCVLRVTNMTSSFRTAVVAGAAALLLYGSISAVAIQYVGTATAHQCKHHVWPEDAHAIHMDWCADNGYATK